MPNERIPTSTTIVAETVLSNEVSELTPGAGSINMSTVRASVVAPYDCSCNGDGGTKETTMMVAPGSVLTFDGVTLDLRGATVLSSSSPAAPNTAIVVAPAKSLSPPIGTTTLYTGPLSVTQGKELGGGSIVVEAGAAALEVNVVARCDGVCGAQHDAWIVLRALVSAVNGAIQVYHLPTLRTSAQLSAYLEEAATRDLRVVVTQQSSLVCSVRWLAEARLVAHALV